MIGIVGGIIAVYTPLLLERMQIDDPVGVIGVHCLSAYWGLISVGLFAQPDHIEGITTMSGGLDINRLFKMMYHFIFDVIIKKVL